MGHLLPESFCTSLSGLHKDEVDARLLDFCGTNFDRDKFNHLSSSAWHEHVQRNGIQTRPGFTELHEFISRKQIPFCLATNSHSKNALLCLELAVINNAFRHMVCREQVANGKPAPDVFLAAAKCLNVPIEWCLILEDSVVGIEAAAASGAFSAYIPSTGIVDIKAAQLSDWLMSDLFEFLETLSE
jgi:HAD superfamily hydrolase (TIGR01509 family)